jgi:hypothetical protein
MDPQKYKGVLTSWASTVEIRLSELISDKDSWMTENSDKCFKFLSTKNITAHYNYITITL